MKSQPLNPKGRNPPPYPPQLPPVAALRPPPLASFLQWGLGDICRVYLPPGIVSVARKLHDSQKQRYRQTVATSTTLLTTLKYTFPLLPLRVIPKFRLTTTRVLRHHSPYTPSSGPNTSAGEGKPSNRVLSVGTDAALSTLTTLSLIASVRVRGRERIMPRYDSAGFLGGGQAALTLISVSRREKMKATHFAFLNSTSYPFTGWSSRRSFIQQTLKKHEKRPW